MLFNYINVIYYVHFLSLLHENERFYLQNSFQLYFAWKYGEMWLHFLKATFNVFNLVSILLPSTTETTLSCIESKLLVSSSSFGFLLMLPGVFFLLWIPQGHLHIAQVPQGEQVQITQDSEVSQKHGYLWSRQWPGRRVPVLKLHLWELLQHATGTVRVEVSWRKDKMRAPAVNAICYLSFFFFPLTFLLLVLPECYRKTVSVLQSNYIF